MPDQYLTEKATLMCHMGFGYTLRAGQFQKGDSISKTAHLLAKKTEDLTLQANALTFSLLALTFMSKWRKADEVYSEIEALMNQRMSSELKLFCSINQAQFHIVKGHFEKARDIVHTAQTETERLGLIYLFPAILIQNLLLQATMGECHAAKDIGARLLDLLSPLENIFFTGLVYLFLGVGSYQAEEFATAEGYVSKAADILSSGEAYSLNHLCIADLSLGWISFHRHKLEIARQYFKKAILISREMPCYIVLAAAHFGMAMCTHQQQSIAEAKKHLALGFTFAAQYELDHFSWVNNRDFRNACLLAVELNVPEAVDYAAHILSTRFAKEAETQLLHLSQHFQKEVRKLALGIRKRIHMANLPEIHILTFGGFKVLRGNTLMRESDWVRSQAKILLKAIISHGSHNVSKELLAEALWPETPPAVSENNFKVSLHRLRKSLEPKMDKSFGFSYIHLRNNLVSLDGQLCHVDSDQFVSLVRAGASEEQRGDMKKAAQRYIQAAEIYHGDYLAQDLYVDWIVSKRRELKNNYLGILMKLGRFFEMKGAVFKAISWYCKAMQADPLLEEACQRLMVLYAQKGKSNQAIQTYEQCRLALRDEIETEPEPLTRELYQSIVRNRSQPGNRS